MKPANATVERSIRRFSESRRNTIRGLVAEARRNPLSPENIDIIRANTTEQDMVAAATILESPSGLRDRKTVGLLQEDIGFAHGMRSRHSALEIAYGSAVSAKFMVEFIERYFASKA